MTPPGGYNALVDSAPYYRPAGWEKRHVAQFLTNNVREQPEENQKIIDHLETTLPWGLPRKATWYSSRFYRCGLIWEGDEFRLRDLYLYDEDFPDSYSAQAAPSRDNVYMALPVMDGMQWSSIAAGKLAGIRLVAIQPDGKRKPLKVGAPKLDTPDNKRMIVTFPLRVGGEARIVFDENAATFSIGGEGAPKDWGMELSWYRQAQAFWKKVDPKNTEPNLDFFKIARVEPKALTYAFSPPTTLHQPELGLPRRNWTYVVDAAVGTFSQPEPRVVLMRPESGRVRLNLAVKAQETK